MTQENGIAADYTLTPDQLEEVLLTMVGLRLPVMVWGPPGVGKSCRVGTPIMMADGTLRNCEDIAVGMEVMGPDGKPRNVLATSDGESEIYEIRPKKGESWYCNDAHVLTLGRSPQWLGDPWAGVLGDIHIQDYIGLGKSAKHHLKQVRVPVDFPGGQPLSIPPYLLGIMLGDGHTGQTLKFTNADTEIIADVRREAATFGVDLVKYRAQYEYGLSTPGRAENPLMKAFADMGLRYAKAGTKFIPHVFKTAAERSRLELLAGLLDTDGSLYHGVFEYVSKSRTLADDVAFVARSLGFLVTERTKDVDGAEYHRRWISGDTSRIPCRTPRKKAPVRTSNRDVLRTGFTVHRAGRGEYAGFEVDGDHRFLLGDFTVTHNSYVCRSVADQIGAEYIDVRALLMDVVDFRGIPYRGPENMTEWAPPKFLPPSDSKKRYVINLDEITAAPPSNQAALYQLVWDRMIGEYMLPEGAALLACGNRETDRGVAYKMPTPLASRFATHIDVAPEPVGWCSWASNHNLAPEVIFFIQFMPDLLHRFDPKQKTDDHSFPCPRTWTSVSQFVNAMRGTSMDIQSAVYRGAVGEEAGVKFSAFLDIWRNLPHPQAIIDDPDGAPIPNDVQVQIALCGSLYKMADDMNFESIVRYGKRLRPELASFMIRSAVKAKGDLVHTKAWIDWTCQNAD